MILIKDGKILIKTMKTPEMDNLEGLKKYFIGLLSKMEKAKFPVGTIRTWNGKKFKKLGNGKWMRYYEGESKGQAQAVRNVIKRIEKAGSLQELAAIIRENKNRFKDENGNIDGVVKQFLEQAKGGKKAGVSSTNIKPLSNGSEKQISWANDIRNKKLTSLENVKTKINNSNIPNKSILSKIVDRRIKELNETSDAKSIIDNKDNFGSKGTFLKEISIEGKKYGISITNIERRYLKDNKLGGEYEVDTQPKTHEVNFGMLSAFNSLANTSYGYLFDAPLITHTPKVTINNKNEYNNLLSKIKDIYSMDTQEMSRTQKKEYSEKISDKFENLNVLEPVAAARDIINFINRLKEENIKLEDLPK